MKVNRLKKRSDFVRLTHVGRKHVFSTFVAQTQPNGLDDWRVGLTASKKVGGAVQRNRAKRRLRAAVDACMRLNPSFNSLPHDLVLIARARTTDAAWEQILQDLQKVLATCAKSKSA